MHKLVPMKVGLAIGGFAAAVHLVWSVIVALGWGQGLVSFIFKLHMIAPAPIVGAFNIGTAVGLIVVTGIVGYAAGFVFVTIWNKVHKA
jgi:hypothetical protein